MTYRIERIYFKGHRKQVLARGLSEEQAQEWCKDPEGSSSTCTKRTPCARTKAKGPWFECYTEDR